MPNEPKITGERLLHPGRFIAFKCLQWTDSRGISRDWETADRLATGAVVIIARLKPSDRVILIRQYRPPARAMVYEFPAGLMDKGETPETAAARELREETGYVASRFRVFPAAPSSAGLSNESVHMVLAEIDEDATPNRNPVTEFDASEDIETILVPLENLPRFYRDKCGEGHVFDAKVTTYVIAMGTS